MPDILGLGRQILAVQPFSVLLGAQLTGFAEGQVELTIPIRPDLLQQFGFVHGGVLSYAADNALSFAGGSVLGPEILTSEYKINYLKPARGSSLRARARVISSGTRQAVCECLVYAADGEKEVLVAVALGTITATGAQGQEEQRPGA
jgi:uncharacterized protein (TIGR00369 family)